MADPVTITLASVKVFLAFVTGIKSIVSTVNLARNYATDFDDTTLQLELLATSVQILVEERRVLRNDLNVDGAHYTTIRHSLVLMKAHFEYCAKILKWYRHENRKQSCPDAIMLADLTDEVVLPETEPKPLNEPAATVQSHPPNSEVQLASKQKRARKLNPFNWLKPKDRKDTTKTNHKFMDNQSTQGSTPITQATSAIVNLGIEPAESAIEDGISEYRKSIFRRVPWIIYDKERLDVRVVKIRNLYRDLDTLLKRLAQRHAHWVLPQSPEVATMWPHITRVSECLRLLHDAMANVNHGGETEFFLSLRLRDDHDHSRADMQQALRSAEFSVSHDSEVFFFRRHFSELLNDDAHTFIVECRPERSQSVVSDGSTLHDLHRLDVSPAREYTRICRNVERWGRLTRSEHKPKFTNIVYYKSNTIRRSNLTLVGLISDPMFREKMLPVHTVRLAKLILYSHLYLASALQGQGQPKPNNYLYYDSPGKKQVWDPTQPLILSPWLSIGFGSRSDDDDLGEGPGVLPAQNFIIPELGLMLWQLGTGQLLDYNEDIGNLIDQALSDTRSLSLRMGLPYTELAQTCLRYSGVPHNLASPEEMAKENTTIKNCISTLAALDIKMSGTISKSILQSEHEGVEGAMVPTEQQHEVQNSVQGAQLLESQRLDERDLEQIGSHVVPMPLIRVSAVDSTNQVVPQRISIPTYENTTMNSTGENTNTAQSAASVWGSEFSLSDNGVLPEAPATPLTDLENNSMTKATLNRLKDLSVPKTELIAAGQEPSLVDGDENETHHVAGPSHRIAEAC